MIKMDVRLNTAEYLNNELLDFMQDRAYFVKKNMRTQKIPVMVLLHNAWLGRLDQKSGRPNRDTAEIK